MEFEQIRSIWENQDSRELFAFDQDTLYGVIRRKSRKAGRFLGLFEWVMILSNLAAAALLTQGALHEQGFDFRLALSALYLAYSIFALVRRWRRRREEVRFPVTMLGELEKAIWRLDSLIRQERSMTFWYVLPLVLAGSLTVFLDSHRIWAFGLVLFLIPASYFGTRWEINRWFLPKKHTLESLRKSLIDRESHLSPAGEGDSN